MMTQLCGQILFDDFKKSMQNDILEWIEVPQMTFASLKNGTYLKQCENLFYFI